MQNTTTIEPQGWPAQIAAIVSRVRDQITGIGQFIDLNHVLTDYLKERGLHSYAQSEQGAKQLGATESDFLRFAEAEFLTIEAFTRLESNGELESVEGSRPFHLRRLAKHLGWTDHNWQPRLATTWRPTVRGTQLAALRQQRRSVDDAAWPGVQALVHEATDCHVRGLEVAAALTARTTVEQVVILALERLGIPIEDQAKGAAQRESKLQGLLPQVRAFAPLDRSATFAALSMIRTLGNDAAHRGEPPAALTAELIHATLPDTLVSVEAATTAHMPPQRAD